MKFLTAHCIIVLGYVLLLPSAAFGTQDARVHGRKVVYRCPVRRTRPISLRQLSQSLHQLSHEAHHIKDLIVERLRVSTHFDPRGYRKFFQLKTVPQADLYSTLSTRISRILRWAVQKYFQLRRLRANLVLHQDDDLQSPTNSFVNGLLWLGCSVEPPRTLFVLGRQRGIKLELDETAFYLDYLTLVLDFSDFVQWISGSIRPFSGQGDI